MYINFALAKGRGLTLTQIVLLQMIYQNRTENHGDILDLYTDEFEYFDSQGMTQYIKGKAKDTPGKLIRLTEKGSKILDEIQIPEVINDDLDVYSWLEKKYKEQGKEIGNAKKTKLLIALFRANSGIERNHLVYLCKVFMNDEKQMEYSYRLEYLFWKAESAYQTKFEINQSRLFQYYLLRKEWFDEKFSTIQN